MKLLSFGVAFAIAVAVLWATPVAAQMCPGNSSQGTCACPTTGSGVTCVGGQLLNQSTLQCYNDPRVCPNIGAGTNNALLNCATGQCVCDTANFPCNSCTLPTSTQGASCGGTGGCPLDGGAPGNGGIFTNRCSAMGCPSGTSLCASNNSCVEDPAVACPAGTTWDPCLGQCTTPYVLRQPASTQVGDPRVTGDITSTAGDLHLDDGDVYIANGKAVRVDGVGRTEVTVGNWDVAGGGAQLRADDFCWSAFECVTGLISSQWVWSGQNIYYPDGDVGIGTDPQYTLDILAPVPIIRLRNEAADNWNGIAFWRAGAVQAASEKWFMGLAPTDNRLRLRTNSVDDVFIIDADGGFVARTGTTVDNPPIPQTGAGTRFMWYPAKRAFRGGQATGTEWDDANVGTGSFAFGLTTRASGASSYAMGDNAQATGGTSMAFGNFATTSATRAMALGNWVTANQNGAMVLGLGVSQASPLVNTVTNSFAVGINSTIPTLFVSAGTGANTVGNVGIGRRATNVADLKNLDVSGNTGNAVLVRVSDDSGATFWTGTRLDRPYNTEQWFIGMKNNASTDLVLRPDQSDAREVVVTELGRVEMHGFKMDTGAGDGKTLVSDATGVGTWEDRSCSGGQFDAVTGATYDGNDVASYAGADAACPAGAHVCTVDEIRRTMVCGGTLPASADAWIINGPPGFTTPASNDCVGWTSADPLAFGTHWVFNGAAGGVGYVASCNSSLPFACCR